MKYKAFCLICIFLFSIFGIILLSNLAHEYTHYLDLRKYEKERAVFCAFNIPYLAFNNSVFEDAIGFYTFDLANKSQRKEVLEIEPKLDKRAYIVSTIVLVVGVFVIGNFFGNLFFDLYLEARCRNEKEN